MNKNLLKSFSKFILLFSFLVLLPIITFAQFVGPCPAGTRITDTGCVPVSGAEGLLYKFQQLLDSIIPLLVSIGVVYFIWGVVMFVIAGGEEAKTKGKDRMIYGIIGLAVIVGMWGLVTIITTTLDIEGATAPKLTPLVIEGQATTCSLAGNPTFQDVLCYITKIINNTVIPLMFALATAMFIWGVINFFIINADEESKKAQGRQFMIWGVIALAVMLSVWGLVGILSSTFGFDGSVLPQVCPPGDRSCR